MAWRDRFLGGALLAAGVATFTELYAVQGVLPLVTKELGGSAADAALTVSSATAGLALAVFPWAALGDRMGRATGMKIALAGAVILSVASGFAPTLQILILVRFLAGAFLAGVPVLAVAYVHDRVGGSAAAPTIASYVAGTTIGGALGRLVAGGLADLVGWRGALLGVSVLSLVATAAFMGLAPSATGNREVGPPRSRIRQAVLDRRLWPYYGQTFALTAVFVAVYNYLGFRLGAPPFSLSAAAASLVFLAYGAGTVSSRLSHRWVGRLGYRRTVVGGLGLAALGLAATAAGSLLVIVVGLVLLTGGFFLCHAAATAATGARARPVYRAQASAVYTVFFYAGSALGGWLFGFAYHAFGWSGIVAAGAATLWLAGLAVTQVRTSARRPAVAKKPVPQR